MAHATHQLPARQLPISIGKQGIKKRWIQGTERMGVRISYLWLPSDGRVLPLRSSSLLWSLLPSELMSS